LIKIENKEDIFIKSNDEDIDFEFIYRKIK
jgi:hypothetical protein